MYLYYLLVHSQFMYLQYNVYLNIVVHTNINIHAQNHLRTSQLALAGFTRQLGCKNALRNGSNTEYTVNLIVQKVPHLYIIMDI